MRGEYGPGDPEQQFAAIMARARDSTPHNLERVRPNGVALDIRGMPLPGGGFVTIYIDITERKAMEEHGAAPGLLRRVDQSPQPPPARRPPEPDHGGQQAQRLAMAR
jgi:hypothetical protein